LEFRFSEPQIEYPGLSDISPNRPRNQPITLQPGGDWKYRTICIGWWSGPDVRCGHQRT